ncbi:MAG: HAD family phosphatase [Gemmatimonadaceae bacterium]|nr:HAD family phosphatase [Gemmatimonadaceae bacterium]MCW5825811.1 HAD family phosphatase [Gemmatimonadaceae bacterium]
MEVPVLLVEFEGVLADTAALREAALAESLAADGIELSAAFLTAASGRATEDAIRRIRELAGAPDDPTAVELGRLRAERAFAARIGKGVMLQPGVRAAVERLSSCARLALVTRASRREVEFTLALGALDGLFRPVIALEDAAPGKPSRAPYDAALARVAELFPGQVLRGVAVEDSLVGVRAAHQAGLPTVLVGVHPPQDAMEAECWVPSLADLTPERLRLLLSPAVKGAG